MNKLPVVLTILVVLTVSAVSSGVAYISTIEVFHKNMPPSLETLEQTNSVLEQFADDYEITYYLITDSATADLIQRYNLPDTHFPFAVLIDGKYSALINGEKIDFVHFPLFMHGIGRHEGNWSMAYLELVLNDTTLLMDENVLPVLDEEGDTPCPGEESSSVVESILNDAVSYLGVPYVYGGTDGNGFDCSGLAWRVFNDNGIPLPRIVSDMETLGIAVDREDLQPGDLLIFNNPKHTGIYLGDGEFIHCSSYLDRGVVITPLSHSNYSRRYSSARRVLGTGLD
ncbi:MAG: C40 family peptidase [Candidatus Aegiribacteria sp.]|nr:C40 family peptidase [Candidatus Aegiribacteria sp.]